MRVNLLIIKARKKIPTKFDQDLIHKIQWILKTINKTIVFFQQNEATVRKIQGKKISCLRN